MNNTPSFFFPLVWTLPLHKAGSDARELFSPSYIIYLPTFVTGSGIVFARYRRDHVRMHGQRGLGNTGWRTGIMVNRSSLGISTPDGGGIEISCNELLGQSWLWPSAFRTLYYYMVIYARIDVPDMIDPAL